MKAIIIICVLFFSCKANNNELMSNLLNEKKALEDSISAYKTIEAGYDNKLNEPGNADTAIMATDNNPLVDSSVKYSHLGKSAAKRLAKINFSIDSLTKMK